MAGAGEATVRSIFEMTSAGDNIACAAYSHEHLDGG
jgi:hypothetical protein